MLAPAPSIRPMVDVYIEPESAEDDAEGDADAEPEAEATEEPEGAPEATEEPESSEEG